MNDALLFGPYHHHHRRVRVGASSPRKPRVPLFLRPLVYTTTIPDLQKWRSWARNLALAVGSKFAELDNGPDSHTLCREVEWFLKDAVEGYDARLRQTTATDSGSTCLRLRADLGELYCLWKERVEQRRPFQYVVGCEHWGDIILSVEEEVLIPRPETVQVVELVDQLCSADQRLREGLWADLGTGSGAIAIGVGRILRRRVVAVDLSNVAVAVASYNLERHGLQALLAPILAFFLRVSPANDDRRPSLLQFRRDVVLLHSVELVPHDDAITYATAEFGAWFCPGLWPPRGTMDATICSIPLANNPSSYNAPSPQIHH